MKRWRSILTIAAVAVLAACGTDPEDSPVGTWTLEAVGGFPLPTTTGNVRWLSGTMVLTDAKSGDRGQYDMTLRMSVDGISVVLPKSGSWELEGSTLSITYDGDLVDASFKSNEIVLGQLQWER